MSAVEKAAEVLAGHQPMPSPGCFCGWEPTGEYANESRQYRTHVAQALADAGLLVDLAALANNADKDVPATGLNAEVIAHLWRVHANCTWFSTGYNIMWSCGILHPGPIHMQPTARDRHFAALIMTQIEADRRATVIPPATTEHTLSEYGTTDCPIERVRANVDDGECSACGARVTPPGEGRA